MAKSRKVREKGDAAAATDGAGIPLSGELLHRALGDLSRTVDGTGFAFARLTCCNKGVTSLPDKLQLYVHLRYIDISGNKVKDLAPFAKLPYVLTLNASGNHIEDVSCLSSTEALPYLSLLNLSNNKIVRAPQLSLQRLTRLALDGNPMTTMEGFVAPPSLTHLSIRGIPIETLDSLPPSETITSLYLSHTPVQQLRQLEHLPQIKTLDLEGVPLPPDQLRCLLLLPRLREISLSPLDPEMGEEQFKVEILELLPRLQWINGSAVTTDDLRAAAALREAKLQQKTALEQQKLLQAEAEQEHAEEEQELTEAEQEHAEEG